jgi:O-antigen/teichoic acid export membrane protein
MATVAERAAPGRTEQEQERLNRQMVELLNEVRVAMPGVQVLFGFLLAVPFQQRFSQTSSAERAIYLATLLAAAVATALLIAPSAYHRVLFQQRQKPRIIDVGTRQFLLGLLALAIAMNGAVLLVTTYLFAAPTVVVSVACLSCLFAWLWFGAGVVRRLREGRDD